MKFDASIHHNLINYLECDDKSYCALMEVYEENYILIKNIVSQMGKDFHLNSGEGFQFHLRQLKQDKYTSFYRFNVTHRKNKKLDKISLESILMMGECTIRVYHDARSAEADLNHKNRTGDNRLRESWTINYFFNDWLKKMHQAFLLQERELSACT